MELFIFKRDEFDLLLCVLAESEEMAKKIFARYLEARPILPGPSEWSCRIAGKVDKGIYAIVH